MWYSLENLIRLNNCGSKTDVPLRHVFSCKDSCIGLGSLQSLLEGRFLLHHGKIKSRWNSPNVLIWIDPLFYYFLYLYIKYSSCRGSRVKNATQHYQANCLSTNDIEQKPYGTPHAHVPTGLALGQSVLERHQHSLLNPLWPSILNSLWSWSHESCKINKNSQQRIPVTRNLSKRALRLCVISGDSPFGFAQTSACGSKGRSCPSTKRQHWITSISQQQLGSLSRDVGMGCWRSESVSYN